MNGLHALDKGAFIVLSDEAGDDIDLFDSKPYRIVYSGVGITGTFIGWLSAEQSTGTRLVFLGNEGGTRLTINYDRIRWVEALDVGA